MGASCMYAHVACTMFDRHVRLYDDDSMSEIYLMTLRLRRLCITQTSRLGFTCCIYAIHSHAMRVKHHCNAFVTISHPNNLQLRRQKLRKKTAVVKTSKELTRQFFLLYLAMIVPFIVISSMALSIANDCINNTVHRIFHISQSQKSLVHVTQCKFCLSSKIVLGITKNPQKKNNYA